MIKAKMSELEGFKEANRAEALDTSRTHEQRLASAKMIELLEKDK